VTLVRLDPELLALRDRERLGGLYERLVPLLTSAVDAPKRHAVRGLVRLRSELEREFERLTRVLLGLVGLADPQVDLGDGVEDAAEQVAMLAATGPGERCVCGLQGAVVVREIHLRVGHVVEYGRLAERVAQFAMERERALLEVERYVAVTRRRVNAAGLLEGVGLQARVADRLGNVQRSHQRLERLYVVTQEEVRPAEGTERLAQHGARA